MGKFHNSKTHQCFPANAIHATLQKVCLEFPYAGLAAGQLFVVDDCTLIPIWVLGYRSIKALQQAGRSMSLWMSDHRLRMQGHSITILFPLDATGQQGHTAQCTAIEGAGLSRGQLLTVIHRFYQVIPSLLMPSG